MEDQKQQSKSSLAFILRLTMGILQDYRLRRWTMFYLVVAAVVVLFLGATLFGDWLREHPILFLLYWGGCAWLTATATLMAMFDILMLRKTGAEEQRRLKQEIFDKVDLPPESGKGENSRG